MKTRENTEIVRFGPLRVLKWALDESTDELLGRAIRGDGALVLTHNLDHIRLARHDAALAASLNEAEITLADGVPLLWLASLAGDSLPGRVNGTDLMEELSRKAANVEVSAVLFGGRDGVAEEAGALLTRTHPGLRVVDAFSPSDRLVSKPEEIEENVAQALIAWLGDPQRCTSAGRAAHDLASQKFSVGAAVESYRALYAEALGSRTS